MDTYGPQSNRRSLKPSWFKLHFEYNTGHSYSGVQNESYPRC